MSIPLTALLVEKYSPESHTAVMSELQPESDHKQYAYLRCLLGPPESGGRWNSIRTKQDRWTRYIFTRQIIAIAIFELALSLRLWAHNQRCRIPSFRLLPVDEVARISKRLKRTTSVVWLLGKSSAVKSLDSLEAFSRSMTIFRLRDVHPRQRGHFKFTNESSRHAYFV